MRKTLSTPTVITVFLLLQFIPLVLFPGSSFSPNSQEWWLPVVLAILAIVAFVQIVIRRTAALWPWYLVGFAQGFNIISRLMMVWPHATIVIDKQDAFNTEYLLLTLVSLVFSTFLLWYFEWPEVRQSMIKK